MSVVQIQHDGNDDVTIYIHGHEEALGSTLVHKL